MRVSIATEVPRYGGVIDGYYRDSTDFDAVVSAGRVRIRIGWRTSSEPTQFEVSNYDPNVTHPQFVRYGRALYLVQRVEGEGPQSRFAAQSIIAQWVKTGRNQGYTLPSQMPLGPTVDVLEPRDLTHPVAAPKEFYVVSDGRRYSAMLRLERNFFEAL